MCRMSGLDCLLGRANNMTKVNTMNLQRVTGKAFYAECQECHRRLLFGEQGHGDTSNCKGWADLDGEPFKAYYCEDCVKGKPEIPSGMISVTQEQFYAALYADDKPARIVDARLDILGRHTSEVDTGEFVSDGLYHMAVRIARKLER
jgi:hypothetical protein